VQGEALTPLLFNFAFGYAIRKVQKNQVGLKLNGTHQLLINADYMNLLADNKDAMKKTTVIYFLLVIKLVKEVNAEKTKYILLFRHQNAGQNRDIKIANTAFENVA
jgi:hypothetical protein